MDGGSLARWGQAAFVSTNPFAPNSAQVVIRWGSFAVTRLRRRSPWEYFISIYTQRFCPDIHRAPYGRGE